MASEFTEAVYEQQWNESVSRVTIIEHSLVMRMIIGKLVGAGATLLLPDNNYLLLLNIQYCHQDSATKRFCGRQVGQFCVHVTMRCA